MALTPTDLPEPVVPATSRWGILARSETMGLPSTSLPRVRGSAALDLRKPLEARISRR